MKRKSLFFVILLISISCSKHDCVSSDICYTDTSFKDAYQEFASILSNAVSNEPALRRFLKEQALKQFDKDYDVFYPFVKDELIDESQTMRECILKYTGENTLKKIETEASLINILIPSWGCLNAFDVHFWNTENDVISVGYINDKSEHVIFENGIQLGILDNGYFPTDPIIIVKPSERMRRCVRTKQSSIEPEYEFISQAFNPIESKVSAEISYIYPAATPGSNIVDSAAFSNVYPEVISSWDEYGSDPYKEQRRYAYFSMRDGDTTGRLNPQIRESIVALRLFNRNCSDDANDPKVHEVTKKDSSFPDDSTMISALWGDGQFEILVHASYTKSDGTSVTINDEIIPVNGFDLFDIPVIELKFYHKTLFSVRKYVYIPQGTLTPKWYYLPSPLVFASWDPSSTSSVINLHIYESDGESNIEVTDSVKTQQGITITSAIQDILKLSFNANSVTTTRVERHTIKQGSDDLGTKQLFFSDQMITRKDGNQYSLNYYSTGSIELIILPQSRVK